MATTKSIEDHITLSASNIGGIDSTSVSLEPGINILTGRNATNRTSFLQAIMAALGSDRASLKGDAEEGSVELTFDDETYVRYLERGNGGVIFNGSPYLEDSELADLFAFLLESNEARRAVDRGDDLRELIMRPIDTDEIQAQIQSLENEKRSIDDRLEQLERLKRELPDLEEQRVSLTEEIESIEDELEAVREDLDSLDMNVEEGRSRKEELERTFADLRSARNELEQIEYDLQTERETQEELEREHERLTDTLEKQEEEGAPTTERLEGRIQELRERKRSLGTTLNELQSVIRFNEDQLNSGGLDLDESLETDGDVTEQLLEASDDIACWTCGSEVDRSRIESTLERLTSIHQEKLTERNKVQTQIDELTDEQKEIREQQREIQRKRDRKASIESELTEQEARIDELETALEEQRQRVEELETETESFEDEDYSDVLDAHREANQLELRREQVENERDRVEERIDELQATLEEREELEERREEIDEELTELRTRVERIEENAVSAFNEHMESILSILEYANIERIWIDRREKEVREGRRKVTRPVFELHVVRSTGDGKTYEDTIDHLSESEREVTGLVFALAGYLVHDLHEIVPFMLLDSLEAIDSDRIADLVEYFESYVDCLVVALLPEDARSLSDDHNYIREI